MKLFKIALPLAAFSLFTACTQGEPMETGETAPEEPKEKVVKTEAEWKEKLTDEQYRVLRNAGTEAPNGKAYKQFKQQGSGSYYCVGCDAKLFHSDQKFDSRCGWPSFWDPAKMESIKTKSDTAHGMIRTEVVCATCDGHLGHLFSGEGFDTPKDQRFCINAVTLRFVPDAKVDKPEKK